MRDSQRPLLAVEGQHGCDQRPGAERDIRLVLVEAALPELARLAAKAMDEVEFGLGYPPTFPETADTLLVIGELRLMKAE